MSAHTPGPWNIGKRLRRQERGLGNVVETESLDVCACHEPFETDQLSGPPVICSMMANGQDWESGVAHANARLIAAAPELFAALQAIFNEVAPGKRPQSADSFLPEHFVEAAGAALAKARGES